MKLSTQPYKGTRDFYPEDLRLRSWMFGIMRDACSQFGYEEYDASILEPIDLYTAKTSEEIVREQAYSFEDRGGRHVVMRPEMTPTVSRMVAARRQELGYPLRLFSIPNCFRYERPQRGRMREFWQLNADVFGIAGVEADAEIIQLTDSIIRAFGATPDMYEIRINSRSRLNIEIQKAEPKGNETEVMRLIDTLDKVPEAEFLEKLSALVEKPAELHKYLTGDEQIEEVKPVMKLLDEAGVLSVVCSPSLARGFDYYTDIVFEVFDKNPENNRSMFGGGRYDGLVGYFGVEPVPTVGFGMGDVTLMNFLDSHGLMPSLEASTQLMVIPHGDSYAATQQYVNQLRESGVNVAVDPTDRKIGAKIRAAEKLGITYVLIIGDDELTTNLFSLKNLKDGNQRELSIEQISTFLNKK